ncbi:MAG: prolyl oligopeptidase family serine peptidase [Polyangiales bacterium]
MSIRWGLLAALVACGDSSATPERDATTPKHDAGVDSSFDAAPDARVLDARTHDAQVDAASPDAALLDWESHTVTLEDEQIVIEKVGYRSQGLLVLGQLCRPKRAGPHPVHIMNHGGFSGLSSWNGGNCADAARNGWVAAESSYRGEDGSEGAVEVCLGEVDDVLQLLAIVRAQPYAAAERVLMSGTSHGGCITLRALQRGAPVQLAVDIFGPTDWASAHAGWKQALAQGAPQRASYEALVSALEQATGGSPEQVPEAYAVRSPLGQELRHEAPLLIVQGTADAFVPTAQACALADDSFVRLHVTVFGTVAASAPAGCEGSWLPGPRPTTWPGSRYLVVYDDVGHNFEGFATSYLIADMTSFLSDRLPGP